jgi:hypothetical protein
VSEDRHNPLPHITLLTTAPKSLYEKMALLATDPIPELGELQIPGGPEWKPPRVTLMRFPAQPDYAKCVIAEKTAASPAR